MKRTVAMCQYLNRSTGYLITNKTSSLMLLFVSKITTDYGSIIHVEELNKMDLNLMTVVTIGISVVVCQGNIIVISN